MKAVTFSILVQTWAPYVVMLCSQGVTRHGGDGGVLANSNSLAYMTIGAKSEWEYDSLIDIVGALSEVETKNPT